MQAMLRNSFINGCDCLFIITGTPDADGTYRELVIHLFMVIKFECVFFLFAIFSWGRI
jgi:hypothetical protein